MIRDYVLLALTTLKKRGVRSWLTMLGIFIGIAAVVSLISLGDGLQAAITGQFSTLGPDRLTVEAVSTGFGPPGAGVVRKLNDRDVALIESVANVESVIPRLLRVVRVDYNKESAFMFAVSMPDDSNQIDEVYEAMNMKIADGRLLKVGDRSKVLLGDDFVSGNEFGKPIRVGSTLTIQGKDFEVVGILERASSFQINSAMFLAEDDMRDLLDIGDEYDLISVRVSDKDVAQDVADVIAEKMRRDRNQDKGEEDFSVQTPVQALESVTTILTVINLVIAGIAAISLVVGGIGITNTMYTSVLERTKEIGIMKAIGARNQDILLLFLIEAGLLGLVGGVVGAAMGLGIAFGVASILGAILPELVLPVTVSFPLLLGALLFSMGVGIISGLIPALGASRLNTVEALRS